MWCLKNNNCKDCVALYIGRTGRNFKSRILISLSEYGKVRGSLIHYFLLAIFLHNNHKFNSEEIIKMLHLNEKCYELNIQEIE